MLATSPIPEPTYPTRMPIRLQIMQALRHRLARITVENGYATNIGANVWYGQQTTPEPIFLPIIFYWDHFASPSTQMGSQVVAVQVQVETYDRIVVSEAEIAALLPAVRAYKPTISEAEATWIARTIVKGQQMPIICNQHLADLTAALNHDAQSGQYDVRFSGLAHNLQSLESDPFFGIEPRELLWCGTNSQWVITYQHATGDAYALRRT